MPTLKRALAAAGFLASVLACAPAGADSMDTYRMGPSGQANLEYPVWFKESFLDIAGDLDEARQAGKRGVVLFISARNCNHCQAFLDVTLSEPATNQRVRQRYDFIGLDIFSDLEITDVDGSTSTVAEFVTEQKARLTPTLLIYGTQENTRLLKLVGFYPPEKFNRVLDYIDGGHHRNLRLRDYLREAPTRAVAAEAVSVDYTLFERPPHALDRSRMAGQRPLLVVFDQPGCGACARFREQVLADPAVRELMASFDAVHLDATDATTPLITPAGERMNPRVWADQLQLEYDVSVVFFDEAGKEVFRLDAESGKDRVHGAMQYTLEKAYLRHENMQRWRREQRVRKSEAGSG